MDINSKVKEKLAEKKSTSIVGLVSKLFESRTQAHIYHLQTKSYAAHKALDEYYTEIIPLVDSLIESYQVSYGILTGYTSSPFQENNNPVAYLKSVLTYVQSNRSVIPASDSHLQNIVDEIVALLTSTLYKLVNLS